MNLGEQLKELRDNILRDVSDIIAGGQDQLWSDDTLLEYIKDAEHRFARESLILRIDERDPRCRVILQGPPAGTDPATGNPYQYGPETYPLDPSIIAVISARYHNRHSDLLRSGHAMVVPAPPAEYMTYNQPLEFSLPPSEPVAFYTDETLVNAGNRVSFSVFPRPGVNQANMPCHLRCLVVPSTRYNRNCLNNESQIPYAYQLDVLEWAAYRAQRTWDGDAGAPTTSQDHLAAYNDAVKRAQKEAKSKMFANINFRYGRNGFTYTR
jgi:hypothetical protein